MPLTQEELERRELQRRERKIIRQLEKRQRKMAARGIHVDLATLKREWLREHTMEEEIDVVGSEEDEEETEDAPVSVEEEDDDGDKTVPPEEDGSATTKQSNSGEGQKLLANGPSSMVVKTNPFSIDNLLSNLKK